MAPSQGLEASLRQIRTCLNGLNPNSFHHKVVGLDNLGIFTPIRVLRGGGEGWSGGLGVVFGCMFAGN